MPTEWKLEVLNDGSNPPKAFVKLSASPAFTAHNMSLMRSPPPVIYDLGMVVFQMMKGQELTNLSAGPVITRSVAQKFVAEYWICGTAGVGILVHIW